MSLGNKVGKIREKPKFTINHQRFCCAIEKIYLKHTPTHSLCYTSIRDVLGEWWVLLGIEPLSQLLILVGPMDNNVNYCAH